MDNALLMAHPIMQLVALVFGFYALWLGYQRFTMNHLGKKIIFKWKQHVTSGGIAIILWILGLLGFYITFTVFGATQITGVHAELTLPVILFSFIVLGTGAVMNKNKKKRHYLPMIHGISALLLVMVVLFELYTGILIAPSFL